MIQFEINLVDMNSPAEGGGILVTCAELLVEIKQPRN
jgi:hypothetical protein